MSSMQPAPQPEQTPLRQFGHTQIQNPETNNMDPQDCVDSTELETGLSERLIEFLRSKNFSGDRFILKLDFDLSDPNDSTIRISMPLPGTQCPQCKGRGTIPKSL